MRGLKVKSMGSWDFPGDPVVQNPPSHAGGAGLIPARGTKIPHASGQLSPRATTTEPSHPKACAQRHAAKTQHSQKKKKAWAVESDHSFKSQFHHFLCVTWANYLTSLNLVPSSLQKGNDDDSFSQCS